jgi:hypothetical protein
MMFLELKAVDPLHPTRLTQHASARSRRFHRNSKRELDLPSHRSVEHIRGSYARGTSVTW